MRHSEPSGEGGGRARENRAKARDARAADVDFVVVGVGRVGRAQGGAELAVPCAVYARAPIFIFPMKSILPMGTPSMRKMSYVVVAWK